MAELPPPKPIPRRIFLRFRTKDDAPTDGQIIEAFYTLSGLHDDLCFIHWQTRENRDTYVVLDVHGGSMVLKEEHHLRDLPHEIFQMSWDGEGGIIAFNALKSETVQKLMLKFTTLFSWCA